ncbi:YlbL family protein [Nocardioides montaniterrae]
MNRRLIAACIATPLVLVFGALALTVPMPFASYSPGPTYDILGKDSNDAEVVQVDGHQTYYDTGGQLRFTTVYSSGEDQKLTLADALGRWLDHDNAVLPYDYVHPDQTTPTDEKQQGAIEMVTSQDLAKAAALRELGYKPAMVLKVEGVEPGTPAQGELLPGDVLRDIDGKPIKSADQVVTTITKGGTDPVRLVVLRDRKPVRVTLTPKMMDGRPRIGITQGVGFSFPFDIELHVDPEVGGPSAGLMFSLAIYDTLTPGSLTGGAVVAGTGELGIDGQVGPIGGIAQKIAAAHAAHAQLFFVPEGNCPDVEDLHPDGMRLVKATSTHEALTALKAWVADHDADLPTCNS